MLRSAPPSASDAMFGTVSIHRRGHRTVANASRLGEIHEESANLVIWRRNLPPPLRAWLDRLANTARFQLDLIVGECAGGAADLVAIVPPSPERRWLEGDLGKLIRRFSALTCRAQVKACFGVVETNACRKLHADWVPLRLLCTYAGPGTEWVPDAAVRREAMVEPLPCPDAANAAIVPGEGAIRRARVGDVVVMKGETYPGNAGHGAVHRSPPIEAAGERRLVLKLSV